MSGYDIRTYGQVEGEDGSNLEGQIGAQRERVAARLAGVDRLVAVMSGKGGVGKSFVAAALAAALARSGDRRVGLVDADLHGPTATRLLGASRGSLEVTDEGVRPVRASGVAVISTDLLLERESPLEWREPEQGSFAWRGAQERGMLMEFLGDVAWGARDWLIVDLPPGSGRLEQLLEFVPEPAGLVAVTLPSGASRSSVARSMELARRRDVPLAGVVENMSGYACPGCGDRGDLFPGAAGRELAERFGLPLLARIPFDPAAARLADRGAVAELLEETEAGAAVCEVAASLRGDAPASAGGSADGPTGDVPSGGGP